MEPVGHDQRRRNSRNCSVACLFVHWRQALEWTNLMANNQQRQTIKKRQKEGSRQGSTDGLPRRHRASGSIQEHQEAQHDPGYTLSCSGATREPVDARKGRKSGASGAPFLHLRLETGTERRRSGGHNISESVLQRHHCYPIPTPIEW